MVHCTCNFLQSIPPVSTQQCWTGTGTLYAVIPTNNPASYTLLGFANCTKPPSITVGVTFEESYTCNVPSYYVQQDPTKLVLVVSQTNECQAGLTQGQVAGIVIGVLLFVGIVGGTVYLRWRYMKKKKEETERKEYMDFELRKANE